jgi:hypothetical protein
MNTLLRLAALGALTAIAVNVYRRQQRTDRELPGNRAQRRDLVADTNSVASGDPLEEQLQPQPQDWRGEQNVLE